MTDEHFERPFEHGGLAWQLHRRRRHNNDSIDQETRRMMRSVSGMSDQPDDERITDPNTDNRRAATTMAIGAGKYDVECTALRNSAEADAAMLIIVNGRKGSGFSVQFGENDLQVMDQLPAILRSAALQLDDDLERMRDRASHDGE